ncbi:Brix-domain-containing protein [Ascobolus immersus RN42]|uniref:Brix-domain-containing protein n=1 Tax=Ascobolus immersus RN42 TaxID=1160509 RepID=A0A3N4IRR2_ASCIM|nr:Brix-domain-containing protein [Ascobolus immersus RN42]
MARRRTKKRTQKVAEAVAQAAANAPIHGSASRTPKTMVIRIGAGEVGPSVSQLVYDVRRMMEPHTAARLKERKSNKLKDYSTMAGPLGVTQLLLFSRAESGNVNLRIARCPRGPTIHFRVKNYSLCKDVKRSQRHPKGPGKEFLTPPLLVMNNFQSKPASSDPNTPAKVPPHELLLTTMFQSMFPPISAQHTPLSSIRRVLLLNRELIDKDAKEVEGEERPDSDYIITVRHYAISTKAVGLSKAVKRLHYAERLIKKTSSPAPGKRPSKGTVPNLGKLTDISDYMLDPNAAGGYTSESEVETDAEVEVLPTVTSAPREGRKAMLNVGPEKRAVKLVEIGPRMTLEMFKIEDGIGEGKVLWHAWNKKTKAEEKELDKRWESRNIEKAERKRVQAENVKRKKEEKEAKKKRRRAEGKEDPDQDTDEDEEWENFAPSDDEDEAEAKAVSGDEDSDEDEDEDEDEEMEE